MGNEQFHIDEEPEADVWKPPPLPQHVPDYRAGEGMVDDFYRDPLLFPSFLPPLFDGPLPPVNPQFHLDLFEHFTDGMPAPGLPLPALPWGLQADKDGVGGMFGDWKFRGLPLVEPDPPDIEQIKKEHQPEP